METQELTVFDRSIPVLRNAGEILKGNQARKDKAIHIGRTILSLIQTEGMTPELDERAMAYMSNVGKALKEMKEGRAEVTQIMDELKKLYTQVENDLDPKKPGTVPSLIQEQRDGFAKRQADERKKRQEEADRKAAKDQERINLVYTCANRLSNYYNDHLLEMKKRLQAGFNAITLDTFEEKEKSLRSYLPIYSQEHFTAFRAGLYSNIHSQEDLEAIVTEVHTKGEYADFCANYTAELMLLKQDLVDKLPSKKAELEQSKRLAEEAEQKRKAEEDRQREAERVRQQQIAQANADQKKAMEERAEKERAEEKLRMEAIQRDNDAKAAQAESDRLLRENQDRLKMEHEAEEAKKKAEQEAALVKEGAHTMTLFDKEATMAETSAPEARQGYDITVLHAAGYVQIFQYWFENEGKTLPMDKIGKTSLDQMKAFCEKVAHKNGTKIESKFLRYDDTFRALNKANK